jgi:hypothetical protein
MLKKQVRPLPFSSWPPAIGPLSALVPVADQPIQGNGLQSATWGAVVETGTLAISQSRHYCTELSFFFASFSMPFPMLL